jgi:hypothetical protein
MKYFTSLLAMFVSCVALAQTAEAPVQKCQENKFTVELSTEVSLYNFEEGTITDVDTRLTVGLLDKIKIGVGLPVYNDSNDFFDPYEMTWELNDGVYGRSGTGFGDVDFFVVANLIDGKCEYLKTDKVWVDITGGIQVPFDGAYASGDEVPHFGAEVGSVWGDISLSYGFSYQFVDEYTFVSPLGGFVNGDVYEGVATLAWKANKDFSLHLKASQYLADGKELFLVGPGFDYELAKNVSFGADVGIPTDSDTPGGELDVAFSAGLGFKF